MNAPNPFRWRRAVALGLVSLPFAGAAVAVDPWPDPPPRPTRTVEILHGTTRVWPPAPTVVQAPPQPRPQPRPAPPAPDMRPPQIWEDPPPRAWEDLRPQPRPEPRAEAPVVEVRPIILTGHTLNPAAYGNTPWLNPAPVAPIPVAPVAPVAPAPAAQPAPVPIQIQTVPAAAPAAPAQPQQPTVVVVRESGEARPAYAPPPEQRGLGTEAILGIALGAAGLGFGYAGWRRKVAANPAHPAHPAMPGGPSAPPQPPGVLLMGKYDAGPRKETAERFEIGMSYETEQQEKKKTKEQEQTAVLEFILSQNIALHADLAADSTELPVADEFDPPPADDPPGGTTT